MSSNQSDWTRVAQAVIRRREDLGMTQSEVAREGGVSLDRVSAIERARTTTYRGGTLRAIERALQWERGSIAAILAGGEPETVAERWTEADVPPERPKPRRNPRTWAELRERMDEDPEYAEAVFNLVRTAQRIGGALPDEEEEPHHHRDAG